MKYFIAIITMILIVSCQEEKNQLSAEEIIDKTIARAGGEKYRRATVDFKFRDHTYRSTRNGGEFQMERLITDSLGTFKDVINNTGYQRFKNDTLITVPDSMATRYSSSVNSVHYFAHLPYGLSDRAVNKKLIGEVEIEGEPYYEINVTFKPEGGGADHHDEFLYWIHKNNYTIDFLAYKFLVNDGGIRFRKAFNQREIEGLRFSDYQNYTAQDFNTDLKDLDEMYEAGKLELLSTIETEDIQVKVRF